MKILIITVLFIQSINSQTHSYDIHILYNNDEKFSEVKNDSTIFQVFPIKTNIDYGKKSYSIDENGKLITKVEILATQKPNKFNLIYRNENESNAAIVKRIKEVKNILKYPLDFEGQDINSVFNLLKNASNVYIIESDETFGYYLLKKVEIDDILRRL